MATTHYYYSEKQKKALNIRCKEVKLGTEVIEFTEKTINGHAPSYYPDIVLVGTGNGSEEIY